MLKKQGNNKTGSKTKRIIAVAVCYLTIGGGVGVMAGSHFTDVLTDHPNGADILTVAGWGGYSGYDGRPCVGPGTDKARHKTIEGGYMILEMVLLITAAVSSLMAAVLSLVNSIQRPSITVRLQGRNLDGRMNTGIGLLISNVGNRIATSIAVEVLELSLPGAPHGLPRFHQFDLAPEERHWLQISYSTVSFPDDAFIRFKVIYKYDRLLLRSKSVTRAFDWTSAHLNSLLPEGTYLWRV